MNAEWSHSIWARIDADKFIANFTNEWEDYGKPEDKTGFVRESANIMGSDFFDGPWASEVLDNEEIGVS